MRKGLMALWVGFFCCHAAFATAPLAAVRGIIANELGKPLPAAAMVLHRAKDSAVVKAAVSDGFGQYEFTALEAGAYFMVASMVGYEGQQTEAFTLATGANFDAGTLLLKPAPKELANVVVKAKKPLFEIRADKTVFNVEQSINAQGSNALELLQKSPGVQVDNNENISMKGKTGVRIYVDGRMTQLDARDLAAYLKSINSNDIESIEMIANPSARYDASGNAGIVNIKLKKNRKYGTNGSVSLGYIQGITPKGNGSINLNYRDKKLNVFGNLGASQGRYEGHLDLYRLQNDTIYDQLGGSFEHNKSGNVKAGMDYFVNAKTTIGVMATTNFGNAETLLQSNTAIRGQNDQATLKTLLAQNNLSSNRANNNINLNYRFADTTGREVNVDADYGWFTGKGNSTQPNAYFDKLGQKISQATYFNNTPTNIHIYSLKTDISRKAWKGVLGYGAKISFVETENSFDFFNAVNNLPVLNTSRSNSFSYTEQINAAYLSFNRGFGETWTVQAGLRAEQTNSEGVLTRADGTLQQDGYVKRNYADFFPSASVSRVINKKNTLGLAYSRRIDRPTYQNLNPFENKIDELTYQKGNAFLRPQYTNNIELTHTFLGILTTAVGYSHVKDYTTEITDTANKNATFIQQRNLATQQIYNASISAPLTLKSWWSGYATVWCNYQVFNGIFSNGKLSKSLPGYGFYLQQAFTLNKKGSSAEISGWFNGPGIWGGTWETKSMGGFDLGFQQPLFGKKANLKLSLTDVLYSQYWRSESSFGGLYIRGSGRNESRTLRVNFTYRFGSNEVKQARERKTGLESEAGRIKGGS